MRHHTATGACVRSYGCTREDCRARSRAYHSRQHHLRLLGKSGRTPSGPTLEHLDRLLECGWTMSALVRQTGCALSTLIRLRGERPPSVTPRVAEAVMAIRQSGYAASQGTVPALGTARRVQALLLCGWPYAALGTALGISERVVSRLAQEPPPKRIAAETARTVAANYEQVCHLTPPPSFRTFRPKAHWVAWDRWLYIDMDDPTAQPCARTEDEVA